MRTLERVFTSPLLWGDMGEVEHKEEVFFLLQFIGAVHLLGSVGGGEGRWGRWGSWRRGGLPLAPYSWRREATLSEHPPPLPPLPLKKLVAMGQRGQAAHTQKVHFLWRESEIWAGESCIILDKRDSSSPGIEIHKVCDACMCVLRIVSVCVPQRTCPV